MTQTVQLKRSATAGAIPSTSDLALGELALNTYDGKAYIKKNVGGTESIVEVGAEQLNLIVCLIMFSMQVQTKQLLQAPMQMVIPWHILLTKY